LSTPDDEMTDENSFEKMDEEKRQKTQSRLESVIGSYDNFMRVVMTTSDTLNKILSNDMAVFTDSLLYESGLDIFDKKLESLKKYEKDVADKGRITCDVEFTENRNNDHREKIKALNSEIFECENTLIPSITESIEKGRTYIEDLNKKLYNIDPEIYNLNVDQVKTNIIKYQTDINDWVIKRERLENSISLLKTTYDKERLEYLESLKIKHKDDEFALKMKIRDHEQNISKYSHDIEIINGEIIKLKERGGKIKLEIDKLKESKTCPTCGQPMTIEHQTHVEGVIREKTTEMLGVRDEIVLREGNIPNIRSVIENEKLSINVIQNSINELNKGFDNTLKEIGEILNDKNDTDKRNSVMVEISLIPSEIEKCQLNIQILQQKVDMYNNSQQQIGENQKTEKIIAAAKAKILDYENERSLLSNKVFGLKQTINDHMRTIELNEETITKFKEQERRDNILKLYKKCVHRDGIPKQMLSNYVIPKANATLGEILLESPFKVWLDEDDLRPKLVYNDIPESVIDCLGASGKERTFSSIVLKFALNRNNVKSRPHIFLLDEIMGKLDSKSVEEFIDILHMIKSYMRRVVIVEHVHQINPDYIINIFIDENKISHAVIN
jgi:DNA repair exonuclease SbcCD ATPase subunit